MMTNQSVETAEEHANGYTRVDWANIDIESVVVPEDRGERRRLLRSIIIEIGGRIRRHKDYVDAVYFKGLKMLPPDPKSIDSSELIDLMKRFPVVRS